MTFPIVNRKWFLMPVLIVAMCVSFSSAILLAEADGGAKVTMVAGSGKAGNIFKEGEIPLIGLELTNNTTKKDKISITYKVMSFENRKVAEGRISGQLEPNGAKKTFQVKLERITAKGTYVMLVEVKDSGGRTLVKEEVPFSLTAKLASFPEDNAIAVGAHFAQGKGDPETLLGLVQEAGITSLRDEYYWGSVEKKKGVYTFNYDHYIDVAVRKGIEPLVILSYGNDLYDQGGAPESAEGIAAFANYAKALAAHLKGKVKYFEVWNEWNGGMGNKKLLDAAAYARLLKATYLAVKEVNPEAMVVGGGMVLADYGWAEQLLKAGGGAYMDAFSYHPYNSDPEGGDYLGTIREMKRVLEKNGFKGPAWVTEIGWGNQDPAKGGVAELASAAYIVQTYAISIANPGLVERVYYYTLINDGFDRESGYENMGLLSLKAQCSAKVGYVALCAFSKILSGAEFVKSYDLGNDLRFYRFRREVDKKDILIAWAAKNAKTVGLNLGAGRLNVIDLLGNAGEAVAVGNVFPATVANVPIYLEGDFADRITLAEPAFKLDAEVKNVVPGDTFSIVVKRSSAGAKLSGRYEVDLPDGWQLLAGGTFKSGEMENRLQIKAPDQMAETSGDIYIYPRNEEGRLLGCLKVATRKVEPFLVTVKPHLKTVGKWDQWDLEVRLANNAQTATLPGGTMSILGPEHWVDGRTYSYPEIKPGTAHIIHLPLLRLEPEPQKLEIPITAFDYDEVNPAGEDETKAFDGDSKTKWSISKQAGQIGYDYPGEMAVVLSKYAVVSANDFPGRDPKDWKFQGSNDGENWVTLDTRAGITFANRFERQEFTFKNSTAYKMYRLDVTANHDEPLLQLAELEITIPGIGPISEGKPASADSEEKGRGNLAGRGNDGDDINTRWCANDDKTGHWWQVDLQDVHDLTGYEIKWELRGKCYKYKVEVSLDGKNWTMAVDKTASTSTLQTQRENFRAKGRYVRLTVTGLDPAAWASFWEFKLYDVNNPMPAPKEEPSRKLRLEIKPASGDPYLVEKDVTFLAATYAEKKIKIDGDIADPEWDSAMGVYLDDKKQIRLIEDWGGPEDLSMFFKTKWDAEYLYVAVCVTDNIHCQPYAGASTWQGDGIQIATDPQRLLGPGLGGYNEMGFALKSDDNTVQKYRWNAIPGKTAGDFGKAQCAVKRLFNAATFYEIAIPWSEIMTEGTVIVEGMDIGFSLLANDNDGPKRRGWIEYMSGIGLGKDPNAFGDLVLVK
ncbi:MAG: discoidin domain-containing protein [Bacteroidota bacterium]